MYLITGVGGFIGFHLTRALLDAGEAVIGVDNLTPYYDVTLKRDRLSALPQGDNFHFLEIDIAEPEGIQKATLPWKEKITHIAHLAAQAGVRYSLEAPRSYVASNVSKHFSLQQMQEKTIALYRGLL